MSAGQMYWNGGRRGVFQALYNRTKVREVLESKVKVVKELQVERVK